MYLDISLSFSGVLYQVRDSSAPPFRRDRFGAGQFGAAPFWRSAVSAQDVSAQSLYCAAYT